MLSIKILKFLISIFLNVFIIKKIKLSISKVFIKKNDLVKKYFFNEEINRLVILKTKDLFYENERLLYLEKKRELDLKKYLEYKHLCESINRLVEITVSLIEEEKIL